MGAGVAYLSTLPIFMAPERVRELLEGYGAINRIFLRPESDKKYELRVSRGGRKTKMYEEGWVEFVRKGDAKYCAAELNGKTLNSKRCESLLRSFVWSVRYLSKFTWADLTGYRFMKDTKEKAQVRAEVLAIKKASNDFVENLLTQKAVVARKAAIQTRKEGKRVKEGKHLKEGERVKG